MRAGEYERKYDEEPPEPVDDTITMGTTPDPDFESSPDVTVDGSVDRGEGHESDAEGESEPSGLISRLRNLLF
jgi:hypothetical protein